MDFTNPSVPAVGSVIHGKAPTTSMAFHSDGVHLFVASEIDARLRLINCQTGTSDQPAYKCEREGIHVVEATHHDHCVLFGGKGSRTQAVGQKNAINYLSIYDNKILRKFRGHSEEVTDLSMSPADDSFLSSSKDRTVRLWNVQQAGCLAKMELPTNTAGTPHAVFDSTGLVFAITAAMSDGVGQYIHLYDARNYGVGAFAELKVNCAAIEKAILEQNSLAPDQASLSSKAKWDSIAFNTSGNQILAKADQGLLLVLDGFEGTVQRALCPQMKQVKPAVACFTPDDKTILSGNDDGSITCWNVATGTVVRKLGGHTGPVRCIAANPKYAQFASSCTNTAIWIW